MRPFFDANVLVYVFDEGEPEKREVSRALINEHLVEGDESLSVQVLKEFYSVSRRTAFPPSAVDAVEAVRYLAAFSPVPEDAAMVLGAVRRSTEFSVSLWGALIVKAAISTGAGCLFTEELQDGQTIDGLRIETHSELQNRALYRLPGE